MQLQLQQLFKDFDKLHLKHGDCNYHSIYGAGRIKIPKFMFVFMNPTGRNISASKSWGGIRAPWIATKNVWKIFFELNMISKKNSDFIKSAKVDDWSVDFANKLYEEIAKNKVYITNLAKCTQIDARPLKDYVFKEYLGLIFKEIDIIKPKYIVSFGNQVSSILLGKNISISKLEKEFEILLVKDKKYEVFPTYYPVGQGMRNMPKAISKIKSIGSCKK